MSSYKIAVIIPYFGKWPSYFNLFLKGCDNNKFLDIIFFTDCDIPKEHPTNVRFITSTLEELSKLISKKLEQDLRISFAYKLCDFRPCYGIIFEDYLKSYMHWAYGDIDLIYGNLKPFIDDRIHEYDILSSRSEILSGSFSIFRNTPAINRLFECEMAFRTKLSSPKYEGLDETAHCNITWSGGKKNELPKFSFTYIVNKVHQEKIIKVSFLTICQEYIEKKDIISYTNNRLFFEREIGYFHYVGNKNRRGFVLPNWKHVPEVFFITRTGFYKNKNRFSFFLVHNIRIVNGLIKAVYAKTLGFLSKI